MNDSEPRSTNAWTAEVCALDDAFNALALKDPRRAQVIELKFFRGLSAEETGEALGVSSRTVVMRDWKLARAWLGVELRRREYSPAPAIRQPSLASSR